MRCLAVVALLAPLLGCAGEPRQFTVPESTPEAVTIVWARVTPEWLRLLCPQYPNRVTFGCAINEGSRCKVYTPDKVTENLIGHEVLQHCYLDIHHLQP